MKRYAMIGAAGYIAPRHMKAIKDTGGELVCALDPYDGVGVIDSYFPDADFFTEPERFDRHLDKLKRQGNPVDYVTICSPNYLHDAHIRMALRNGCDAICEKPLVLNARNLESLETIEQETGKKVYTILQLRLHKVIKALKEDLSGGMHEVDLEYVTRRGKWYDYSWKGDKEKSGGVATNIGVHFFDMLGYLFGEIKRVELYQNFDRRMAGYLEFERARVGWMLSIDHNDLPKGKTMHRHMTIDGKQIDFTDGFTDLHTESYQKILSGEGFTMQDAKQAIQITEILRI